MTAKQEPTGPPHRGCTIHELPDGTLVANWPSFMIRFLLSDGRTVDVVTDRDDSDLRGALLDHFKVERIDGSTRLPTRKPADGQLAHPLLCQLERLFAADHHPPREPLFDSDVDLSEPTPPLHCVRCKRSCWATLRGRCWRCTEPNHG